MSYNFLVSKLGSDKVMDIRGAGGSGTPVIIYTRKTSGTDNQLWRKEQVGDSTFYLVSKQANNPPLKINIKDGRAVVDTFGALFRQEGEGQAVYFIHIDSGNVLDVEGNNSADGTSVIAYHKKSPPADNQRWEIYPAMSAPRSAFSIWDQ